MSEYVLTSAPPLAGYERRFGAITLKAPGHLAFVSIALPLGGEEAAQAAIMAAYGQCLPGIGKALTVEDGTILMRMGQDQGFVLFAHDAPDGEAVVASKLNGAAYITDQTDVWTALEINGAGARRALARICPLDLHDDAFAVMDVARTVMEHLGVIILRTGPQTWFLLSASSSSESFVHVLETSIRNTT